MSVPPSKFAAALSETEFMEKVITRATARGWMVAHFRPARTEKGWRTPMTGNPGFPDLILAKDGKLLVVELKSETGRVRPEQREWLDHACGEVWRPSDWPTICEVLDS